MQLGQRAGLKQSRPMRDIFGEALYSLCTKNHRIVVLDGDLGNSTKAEQVRNNFPERFFNIGIAESNLVGIGAGLSACGFIPYMVSFSSFLLCNAYDQLRLAVSLSNINAKVVGSHGGITLGKDGPTQMGIEDLALAGGLPNVVILVPSDPVSMHHAVHLAADCPGPVFIRSSRVAMPYIYPRDNSDFKIGRANEVRQGKDVTIIGCGIMVSAALDAAVELEQKGISARVLDMHTLRPLDTPAIQKAAQETGCVVCAEEHLLTGGMGSNIARVVSHTRPVPMRFVGLSDTYVESAPAEQLLQKYHLTSEDIVSAALEAVEAKSN